MGWMGGTFDPIHWGHIEILRTAQAQVGYDRLFLLPAAQPAHKHPPLAAAEHRLRMARLVARHEGFSLSMLDCARSGSIYTVDTLERIHARHPHAEHDFIIGADSLMQLHRWRQPERVLSLCRMVVIGRPGFDRTVLLAQADELCRSLGGRILVLDGEGPDISSSAVRQAALAGASIERWVPPYILRYIQRHGLYQSAEG